jgi:hypothetical protein
MTYPEPVILDRIPFTVNAEQLLKTIHMEKDSEDAPRVMELARAAESLGRPKAIFREAYVEARGEDTVVVNGVSFKSRVMRVNLDKVHRVFPFITTSGMELETWSSGLGNMLEGYWADAIKRMALVSARAALDETLAGLSPGTLATMNPGSLEDWPISEQRPLFTLLGDPMRDIGVHLKETFLMIPTKTTSGIRFPTEVTYENCQLCARENCPGRRAPYDKTLYDRKYKR